MKITDQQLSDIKQSLINAGMPNDISEAFNHFLSKKDTSRFIELILWLRKNRIAPTEFAVSSLYKLDVVVRRMFSEILKPIELEIQAHLVLLFKKHKITYNKIFSGVIFENIYKINNTLFKKKISTTNFVLNTIGKLQRNGMNLYDSIRELTFGQIIALISILKNEFVSELFENGDKAKNIKTLQDITTIRNHIAHHKLLFTTKKIIVAKKEIKFSQLLVSLSSVATGDYTSELINKIENYRGNWIRKHLSEKEHEQAILNSIFETVKVFLNDV